MTRRGNYDAVVALFCAFLLISNVGATKLLGFGPFVMDGGAFLFPLTYIFGDVLAEVYGMAAARRAIILGFICSALASLTFLVVDAAPPAADYEWADAWHAVLGFVPRIVAASLAGYLAGQFLNAHVLVKMKERQGSLWGRLLGSTIVGEFADTLVFCLIAWSGEVSVATMVNYVAVGYAYKVGVETVFLPVTSRVIGWVRAHEETDFAPQQT
jgi:uncharacterized integral membrane protein (TIGR00697 family)